MIQIRNIKPIDEYPVLVSPNGEILGKVKSEETFLDIRLQIKEEGVAGYKFVYKGKEIHIDKNGTLDHYPKGFFDKTEEYLIKLI